MLVEEPGDRVVTHDAAQIDDFYHALEELHSRRPDRVLATNVEFWSAVVLDFAEVPSHMFTSMFTCARVAGWSAHILEQKKLQRLVRPSARYVGPGPRKPAEVEGWEAIPHGA